MNLENINKIINSNYSVVNTFDSHYDGSIARYKTKDEAESIKYKKGGGYKGYLKGRNIVHNLAIVGEVDFNGRSAYIFNRKFSQTEDTVEYVTAGFFDELKECYVFSSMLVSSKMLHRLIDEYHNRGGFKFEKYFDYEDKIFNPIRMIERRSFRTEIVENILKHGYRETGKLTWSNGKIRIKQVSENRISLNTPSIKTIIDLDVDLNYKIEINSIFGNYYKEINVLKNNIISLPCQSKVNSHSFVIFTVELIKNN